MLHVVTKWGEPKPGHEDEFWRALIDRQEASIDMLKVGLLGRLFQRGRYRTAYARWGDALDRMKIHGRDTVRTAAVIEREIRQEERMAEHHVLLAKNLRLELSALRRKKRDDQER